MAAADYPRLLADIAAGLLDPAHFIARTITLGDTPGALGDERRYRAWHHDHPARWRGRHPAGG